MNRFLRISTSATMLGLVLAATTNPAANGAEKIPVTTASQQALSEFVNGRTLVDNLRLTDATAHFQAAVKADPSFALGYLFLAQTAPTAKEFFEQLEKAHSLASSTSAGEQLWIEGFRAGAFGDPQQQKTAYDKLVQKFPDDERAQTLLGSSYLAQQEYEKAAKHLEKAISLAPEFAPAYNQLGYVYRFLKRYEDAEKTFKRYTELIPQDPNPYDSYAELLLKVGRFPEAIAQYRQALSVDPRFANSLVGIAAALMYQGKHDEARAELGKALSGARTDGEKRTALFNTAVTYVDEGKSDMALREMEKEFAVAKKINDLANMSADLVAIGNILLDMGRHDEAFERFEKSLSLIKGSSLEAKVKENAGIVYHYNVGRVALAKKDYAGAEKHAKALMKGAEDKNNTNLVRLAHELNGSIALDQKQYSKAIDELKLANEQNPYNLYRLALAYQGMGSNEEARKWCTEAARFNGLPLLNYGFVRHKAEQLLTAM